MTISEIAKLAGVSSAAVSRYFNDGYLSPEKREVIERVVKETGYRPSPQAATLRTRKSNLIGVVLPRIESHSIARVVAGISSVMNRKKYKIMLASTENNPEEELRYLKVFDEKQVDGVIFVATVMTEKHRKMIKKSSVPIVVVGQQVDEADCIYHDDYHATYELVELLHEKKCQRLAYIAAIKEDRAVGYDRTQGYRDAVKAFGMTDDDSHIVIADFSMESGYEAMGQLLEIDPAIDAVIAATDTIAVGALRRLREHGRRVPEDILLAGIGNSPMSQVTTPMLTTMNYAYEDSGSQAAKLLLKRISGEKNDPEDEYQSICLPHQLIERESTGGV